MNSARRYAVIGDPIAHSLSPLIHQHFAQQAAIELDYSAIHVSADTFADTVNEFFVSGGAGLNVTMPLKELAFDYADIVSDRAMNAGAVNTLSFLEGDTVYGDNTDGAGLIADLRDSLGIVLTASRILVLGAGGAVRGCLASLMSASPRSLHLYNRTPDKAENLATRFSHFGNIQLLPESFDDKLRFDLIINGTSASLDGARPALDHRYLRDAICYDMMYGEKAQAFLQWATAQGARAAHDGLGMLVGQAAESFRVWHDVQPVTRDILQQLRAKTAVRTR